MLLALGLVQGLQAQNARFFQLAGPVASTITRATEAGSITWTNSPTNATFTVQTAQSLSAPVNWADFIQVPVTNGFTVWKILDPNPPVGMVFVPAGSFTMGDSLDGESDALPLHTVYVSALYMDQYDVTSNLWNTVYQWATNHGYHFDPTASGKAANHPVQTVDWYDCVKWCNARSEMTQLTPAYYTDATQATPYRSGDLDLSNSCVKWTAGYRLPTEAEWEKAARGGLSGQRFPWGDAISESQANYYSTFEYSYDLSDTGYNPTYYNGFFPSTSPVNAFTPNGYGLYDMAGNVWQWCWDWYGNYDSASQTDPLGPASGQSGSTRVFRGGSWDNVAFANRSAGRDSFSPTNSYNILGFRSVLPAAH